MSTMTTTDEPQLAASADIDISPRRRTFVLAAMCLALVVVVAGVAMLTNALPALSESLRLSQSTQTWVADSYVLALAALLLVAGAIGDRYGRRGALLVGIAIFAGGSTLSSLANSGGQLIAFRALTGAGAALIMPGTLSTITSVFPPNERARAVGIWAGFAGAGGTLGLLGSGLLLEAFSWKAIFVVTAIVAAITFAAVLVAVPTSRATEHVSLDPLGTLLSAVGIGAIVVGIIEGPERGWTAPVSLVGLLGGIALLAAFVLWELRVETPLLDPRLFRYRGFATGSVALTLLFLGMFGVFVVMLQYLQFLLGYSALKAAAALMPMMIVVVPLSTVAAVLSQRFGQKLVGSAGLLIAAVGIGSFATLQTGSSYLHFLACLMTMGIGFALAMTPATNAIVSSLPRAKQGVASAVNDTTREVGTALGIALAGSAFNIGYRHAIGGHLGGVPTDVAAGAREAPALAFQSAPGLGERGDALLDAARHAYVSGMRYAVILGGSLLLIGAIYAWVRGPSTEEAFADDVVDLIEPELELVGAVD